MPQLHKASVLFDLDGTFIDTAADLTAALNHAIEGEDIRPYEVEVAKHFVGKGTAYMLKRAFDEAGKPLPQDRHAALTAKLLEHYLAHIARRSRPFPGAVEAARALREAGAQIGICTNKLIGPTRKLLGELGLGDFFDMVTGGDSFDVRKPDPEHLNRTFALAGERERLFMVGDTVNDFAAAKGAGALAIGVRFGYGSAEDLAEAEVLIDHFDQLPRLILSRCGA